jgi:hypothetical protein
MIAARLHVTFGYSAGGSLEKALSKLACSDEVAPLGDDFSMGPIDPGDADQRAEWQREELDDDEPAATSEDVTWFWDTVAKWPGELVVWMSSRSGLELCGLHALVWRLPNANVRLIDIANIEFRSKQERLTFGFVRDEHIIEHDLLSMATPMTDLERAALRRRWQQLRQENAALRLMTDHGLKSVPIDYLDDRIRARITDEWQSCGRVVGDVMGTFRNAQSLEFHSDSFLFARMLHLLDTDEFEGQKDEELWSMQSSRIRRRPR